MKISEILFDKFSKNLQNICAILELELEEKFQLEAYICPISFLIYTKDGLSSKHDDQLTLEHVPPESLNGKALCLTNRISNSTSGHTLDIALLNHVKHRGFKEGVTALETKVYIENVKMDGFIDLTNKEKPQFNFYYKKRHQGNERVKEKMLSEKAINLKFSISQDNRATLISFLRIAYLYAFGHLGYSLIFGVTMPVNPNFDLIRQQINNPEENIIRDIILIDKDLDAFQTGVNIIHAPPEFRSIFVVFDVITTSKEWRYGIFLPGPDDFGFKAIKNIKDALNSDKRIEFVYHKVPRLNLTELNGSKYYYDFWCKNNGLFCE